MRAVRRLALLATVLASLCVAAPASAAIVPQKSIAGVRLGMTEGEVRALLGKPSNVIRDDDGRARQRPVCLPPAARCALPPPRRQVTLQYRALRLRVDLRDELVTTVATTSRHERTARGVGVGSSERAVRRLVRGVLCDVEGSGLCWRWSPAAVTSFRFRRGRVIRVRLDTDTVD